MVTGVSNSINTNNLTFSKNAVKYLQDGKLTEDSLGKQIKDSALGSLPFAGIFGAGLPALQARKEVKKNGGKFADVFKQKVEEASGIAKGATKGPGRIAKFFKLDKLGNLISKSKVGAKVVNWVSKSSIPIFIGFNMLFQLGEIIPAFKDDGIIGGIKQIGKSVVKSGADAVAYAGGMLLGAKLGSTVGAALASTAGAALASTAAGGALGSLAGPVGIAIGAVAGIVLGGVFSTVAGKVCKLFVGKDHSEKKADKEKKEAAQQIAQDEASLGELKTAVEAKVLEKAQNGKLTEDDIAILEQAQAIEVNNTQQEVAFKGNEAPSQTSQAQPIGTVTKPAEETNEQIMARLQKIPANADLGIEYEVPSDYSWTTSV